MSETKQKIRLDEVTLMRCILALLIVFMHSFTCYNGSWRAPDGFVDVPLYKWLTRISFACTLEAFVFISGYLFAFQRITLKRMGVDKCLIFNKLKRLILPSIIFSTIYFVIFYEFKGWGEMIYAIINGCGHLWFLPMLFWCFIGCWLLLKVNCKEIYKVVFLVMLNIFPTPSLPLRITSAFSFMLYFYSGYLVYQHRSEISNWLNAKRLMLVWTGAVVFFAVFRPLRDLVAVNDSMGMIQKVCVITADNIFHILYAGAALSAFYFTALNYVQNHTLRNFTIKLAGCCFGIYIFQQFVLQYLYYKTSFPTLVGPYWLPWCGFIIATVVSYGLTILLLKTKTGKFLIG